MCEEKKSQPILQQAPAATQNPSQDDNVNGEQGEVDQGNEEQGNEEDEVEENEVKDAGNSVPSRVDPAAAQQSAINPIGGGSLMLNIPPVSGGVGMFPLPYLPDLSIAQTQAAVNVAKQQAQQEYEATLGGPAAASMQRNNSSKQLTVDNDKKSTSASPAAKKDDQDKKDQPPSPASQKDPSPNPVHASFFDFL